MPVTKSAITRSSLKRGVKLLDRLALRDHRVLLVLRVLRGLLALLVRQ